jgi:hypothetical protein
MADYYSSRRRPLCTGFLYGAAPTLDPEGDGSRVSTNISQYTYPPAAYFSPVQRGSLYSGAPSVVQGGAASYLSRNDETYLFDVGVVNPGCLGNCTMGGCDDPTSTAHDACRAAGCCRGGDAPAPAPVLLNSERVTSGTNCLDGPAAYCASDLDYFNCHPWSTRTPATDATCAAVAPQLLPWA